MRTQAEARNVRVQTTHDVHRARINATPEMFKLLYKQLYSNKEEAVVRELLTNAWDAHVDAGTTRTPIEIHIPNAFEPYFEIKDFGTGIHPDKVNEVYMDYGNSTKTHSDDFIGGFGIGAKSPYAITDQFTVTTRYRGTAHVFQAYIDARGGPCAVKQAEYATDEPNGVTVHVPLPAETAHRAEAAAIKLLPFVPTRPVIKGMSEDRVPVLDNPLYDLGDQPARDAVVPGVRRVTVLPASPNHPADRMTVVLGITPYQIDALRRGDIYWWTRRYHTGGRRPHHVVIEANVGTFDITSNREELALTDDDEKLLQRLREVTEREIREIAKQQAAKATTWYTWARAMLDAGLKIENRATDIPRTEWVRFTRDSKEPTLNTDAFLELADARLKNFAEWDPGRQAHFRTFKTSICSLQDTICEDVTIYVAEKTSYPGTQFFEEVFNNVTAGAFTSRVKIDKGHQKVMLLVGDIAKVRKAVRHLDLPNPVKPAPAITRKGPSRAKLGRSLYTYTRVFHTPQHGWMSASRNKTAPTFLDELDPKHKAIVTNTPLDNNAGQLTTLLKTGAASLPKTTEIHHLHLDATHTRVYDTVRKELEARNQLFDRSTLTWDRRRLRKAATMAAMQQHTHTHRCILSDCDRHFRHLQRHDTLLGHLFTQSQRLQRYSRGHEFTVDQDERDKLQLLVRWIQSRSDNLWFLTPLPDPAVMAQFNAILEDFNRHIDWIKRHHPALDKAIDKYYTLAPELIETINELLPPKETLDVR